MGYDGSLLTENYLESGDFPTFQIYDSSESEYLSTDVSITTITGDEYFGWQNFGFYVIEQMLGYELITMNWEFSSRTDLISYLGIPGDSSVVTILEPLGTNVQGMVGAGNAALLSPEGLWLGSLTHVNPTSGYWLILDYDDTVINYGIQARPTDPNIQYHLKERLNLISYVGTNNLSLDAALPDSIEMNIQSIQTSGKAAMRDSTGNWIGSLQEWNILTGYWVDVLLDGDETTDDTLIFSFVNESLTRKQTTRSISG
jgi:hypothetical protein